LKDRAKQENGNEARSFTLCKRNDYKCGQLYSANASRLPEDCETRKNFRLQEREYVISARSRLQRANPAVVQIEIQSLLNYFLKLV